MDSGGGGGGGAASGGGDSGYGDSGEFRVLGRGGYGIVSTTGKMAVKTFFSAQTAIDELQTMQRLFAAGIQPQLEGCGVVQARLLSADKHCRHCADVLAHGNLDAISALTLRIALRAATHYHVTMPTASGDVHNLFDFIDQQYNPDEALRRKARVVHRLVLIMRCITKATRGQWAFSDAKVSNVLWAKSTKADAIEGVVDGYAIELWLGDIGSFCVATGDDGVATYGNPCIRPGQFPPCNGWMNVFAAIVFMSQALNNYALLLLITNEENPADAVDKCQQATAAIEVMMSLGQKHRAKDSKTPMTRADRLKMYIGKHWNKINRRCKDIAEQPLEKQNRRAEIGFDWATLLTDIERVAE